MNNESEILNAEFKFGVHSISDLRQATLPEVVFFGRSNVGKSSLLNSLTNRKTLARTSKQPGRTQALNYFEVEFRKEQEKFQSYFVDAPGFGYATVAKSMKKDWNKLMAEYLAQADRYVLALLLVDARRNIQDEESWLIENIPEEKLLLVATKADKCKQKERALAKKRFARNMLFTSTLKGEGVGRVRNLVAEAVFNASESS